MRKNKMMRAASALLVAVLLTTCAISGTFAKYVTQDDFSDTARVAKWGVSLQILGNLYGDSYGASNKLVLNNDASISVQSNNATAIAESDDVVAPGTSNTEGFRISLTGTPEVSTQTKINIQARNVFLKAGSYGLMVKVPVNTVTDENFASLGDLYTLSGTTFTKATVYTPTTYYTLEDDVDTTTLGDYYPVNYAMTGDTVYTGDTTVDTLNAIADALAKKVNTTVTTTKTNALTTYEAVSETIAPNVDLDTKFNLDDITITWAWAYDADGDDSTTTDTDKADTILGLLMQRTTAGTDELDGFVVKSTGADTFDELTEYEDYCLDADFSVEIIVTQVD